MLTLADEVWSTRTDAFLTDQASTNDERHYEATTEPSTSEADDAQTPEQRLDWLRERGVEIETTEERSSKKASGECFPRGVEHVFRG